MIYGSPNVLKMSDTSAGMKTRRDISASSAVEDFSRSKSFILLQAERGAMAGKYIWASSILPYVFITISIGAKLLKIYENSKFFMKKNAININKLQEVAVRGFTTS